MKECVLLVVAQWLKTGTCGAGEHCRFKHMEKSNICWDFETFGTCDFGDQCRFIHGVPDECRQFASVGLCRYGDKCRFRHDKKRFA